MLSTEEGVELEAVMNHSYAQSDGHNSVQQRLFKCSMEVPCTYREPDTHTLWGGRGGLGVRGVIAKQRQ